MDIEFFKIQLISYFFSFHRRRNSGLTCWPYGIRVCYRVCFIVLIITVLISGTGVINEFASNKGKRNGPASWLKKRGLERPVSVKFDKPGTALYVVDFGILKTDDKGSHPQIKTGMIWRISKK